jgi:hypothetical protein
MAGIQPVEQLTQIMTPEYSILWQAIPAHRGLYGWEGWRMLTLTGTVMVEGTHLATHDRLITTDFRSHSAQAFHVVHIQKASADLCFQQVIIMTLEDAIGRCRSEPIGYPARQLTDEVTAQHRVGWDVLTKSPGFGRKVNRFVCRHHHFGHELRGVIRSGGVRLSMSGCPMVCRPDRRFTAPRQQMSLQKISTGNIKTNSHR